VGVSAEHGELGELRQALQEARKSQDYWYFLSNQQLLFYEDVPQADQEQLHRLSQQVSRLSQRTAELEISSDLHEVEEFFAAIRQSGVSARFARHLVFTLAVSIQQLSVRWLSFEVQDSLWKHWGDPLVLVEESERFEALEECVLPLLREIVSTVVETRKARERDERISRVLQYIDTHYHEMISLDDVAEVAQMHPSVFSTWFKRSIGQNYIDYLTNTRIEAAKRLLSGSERYVKEVSSRVGFQDSRYFGQVFKRMTGITPKEYQEMHGVPHARSRN
jgi:two-component system response regulator YesN